MAPRKYDTPVRDARKVRTRQSILESLATAVVEDGVASLSVQEIADRAGVSHRTVYRHFDDRQALIDELQTWVQQQLDQGLRGDETDTVDGLLATMPWIFARFDDMAIPAAAMVRISVAENRRSQARLRRSERFRNLLEPTLAGRYEDPEAVSAVLRLLLGSLTWWVAREEFGLDGRRTGNAVAAIVDAVLTRSDRE